MKEKILPYITNWFLKFLQLQLVISLTLLVILPSWGISMSILSPIGNIICTPFFIVFLLLSSIIFFLELLHIPNGIFIYLLENIAKLWLWLVPDFHNTFLTSFTKPPILFLLILPIATITILTNKRIKTITQRITTLSILFGLSCLYLKVINKPSQCIKNISCNNGHVTYLYHNGTTALIDPGFIGRRISAPSWIYYTLIPEIIKSSGSTQIDHLIIMQPGKVTFDAIQLLIKSLEIKQLYLVNFYGPLKRNTAISLYKLKELAKKRNTRIVRIGQYKKTISLNTTPNIKICIAPEEKNLTYNKTKYPALSLTYNIDNQETKIYSAKIRKYITNT